MPTITLTAEQLERLQDAIRQGPQQVIGFDRNSAQQKAFEFGHSAAKDHVYAVAKEIGLFPSRTYEEAKEQDEIADGYAPPRDGGNLAALVAAAGLSACSLDLG